MDMMDNKRKSGRVSKPVIPIPKRPKIAPKREKFWVVEKIVDKRIVNGKIEYFIKWKDWDESENTWEPIDHLNEALVEKVYELEERMHFAGKRAEESVKPSHNRIPFTKTSRGQPNYSRQVQESVAAKELKPKEESAPLISTITKDNMPITHYNLGYEVEEVLGFKGFNTPMRLALVKWKHIETAELVPYETVKARSPQELIKYYDARFAKTCKPARDFECLLDESLSFEISNSVQGSKDKEASK